MRAPHETYDGAHATAMSVQVTPAIAGDKHAVFAAIPAWGHLRPLLTQAAELTRRGWRTTVVSTDEMRPRLEKSFPGVTFFPAGPAPGGDEHAREIHARASAEKDFTRNTIQVSLWALEFWPVLFDAVRALLRSDGARVVVADLASGGAYDAAVEQGVPVVINNPDLISFLSSEVVPPAHDLPATLSGRSAKEVRRHDRIASRLLLPVARVGVNLTLGRRLNAHRRSRALPPADMNRMFQGRMVLVNSSFGPEYARSIPPNVHLVGPMIGACEELSSEERRWLDEDGSVVYVSLGTIALPDEALLDRIADGLAGCGLRVLWALRTSGAVRVRERLRSAWVAPWVSSTLGVLSHPNVRVFLSHCGINSAYEAIVAGTPVVALPFFADQRDMATRLVDAGVAVSLDKALLEPGALAEALRRVATDPAFRRSLPALQSCVRLAGGVVRAADLIEHVAAHGVAHFVRPRQTGE